MVGKGNPGQIRPASWEKPSDLLNTRVPVVSRDLIYVGSVWGTLEGAMPHPKGKTASWLHTAGDGDTTDDGETTDDAYPSCMKAAKAGAWVQAAWSR